MVLGSPTVKKVELEVVVVGVISQVMCLET